MMIQLSGFSDEIVEDMKRSEQKKLRYYQQILKDEPLKFDIILLLQNKKKNIELLELELLSRKANKMGKNGTKANN